MGCMHPQGVVEFTAESTITDRNTNENKNQYTLNAMRSLEGVARLWHKHIEELESQNMNGYNDSKPSLKKTTSVPINVSNNPISNHLPIAISTYFFLKSPIGQPNLIQSHTSPNHRAINKNKNNNINDKPIQNMVIPENMDFDQDPDHKFDEFVPKLQPEKQLSINVQYDHENINTIHQKTPHRLSSPNMPSINLNLMPVFSHSHEFHGSPGGTNGFQTPQFGFTPFGFTPFGLTPLSLNDNDSTATIVFPETLDGQSIQNINVIKNAYSENNIFVLKDMNLNQNDFIEYEINNIGFGASGIVTKAFHFNSCKMVAIKQCRSKKNIEIIAFKQEAKLYKKFENNKNIIDIIGFGNDLKNGNSIMALELMDLNSIYSLNISENISDISKRELIVGYIALNVLNALCELHLNGYVHNDIKPENILSNKYGNIKLSDFGTVLQLGDNNEFLYQNNGTQKFQSPEKTTFNVKYNSKTDIWSLGITCYELLFGESNTNEISYTVNPPILQYTNNKYNLSKNCCDFINKCLIINQFDRPSAEQLLTHLWFKNEIKNAEIQSKWPWINNKIYNNEDLLFMISALILYYSTKKFNDKNSGSIQGYHRRVSVKKKNTKMFSDEERIENISKYAFCTKDHVIDRIQVTVSYIKSQLNNKIQVN